MIMLREEHNFVLKCHVAMFEHLSCMHKFVFGFSSIFVLIYCHIGKQ